MDVDELLTERLNTALNEAAVCGLRFDPVEGVARLLVEVQALPDQGPIDPDPRRALVMSDVASIAIWLRVDRSEGLGPPMGLGALEDVEAFFASLQWADAMYGQQFLDNLDAWEPTAGQASLEIIVDSSRARHSLRRFTECGRREDGAPKRYLLAGIVLFGALHMRRGDGTAMTLAQFADDGTRWWDAFYARDDRASVEAQRRFAASALHWRGSRDGIGGALSAD